MIKKYNNKLKIILVINISIYKYLQKPIINANSQIFKYFWYILLIIFFYFNYLNKSFAVPPRRKVPKKIYFADMKIYMCNNVRSRIQTKVDSLRRWKFQEMVDQANLIFPIMEPIIKQEGIPDEIKYLAMHESRLVLNCISPTEDYGIWAFNDIAIKEVGITVNNIVDERLHLIYATRAMCRKMKLNYKYFKNWIHTILAYNKGKTGTEKIIKLMGRKYIKKTRGKSIFLNMETPNYIIYFLAHKIAFEKDTGKHKHPIYKLHIHEVSECKNFNELANKCNSSINLLCKYNPWLKCPKYIIPKDKKHKVIVPIKHKNKYFKKNKNKINKKNIILTKKFDSGKKAKAKQNIKIEKQKKDEFPRITKTYDLDGKPITLINNLYGIVAKKGMTINSIAKKAGISVNNFKKYNDIKSEHKIIPGQVYYLQRKGSKAYCNYHITKKGDTWWSVSQKYGVRKNKLLIINNRISKEPTNEYIQLGRILHLKYIRPKKSPIKYVTHK